MALTPDIKRTRRGLFDQRVSLQAPAESQNDLGEITLTWSTTATRWAQVAPIAGREYFQAAQVMSEITHRVRLVYDTVTGALTTRNRLLLGSRVLEIVSILNLGEQNFELELLCKETQ